MKGVAYTGFLLDEISQEICKKIFDSKVFNKSIHGSYELKCHHITLNMGCISDEYKQNLNQTFQFQISGHAIDEKVAAISVKPIDCNFEFKNKIPHVTIAVNYENGGKPFMSNNLNFKFSETQIFLTGTLVEFNSDGSIFKNN